MPKASVGNIEYRGKTYCKHSYGYPMGGNPRCGDDYCDGYCKNTNEPPGVKRGCFWESALGFYQRQTAPAGRAALGEVGSGEDNP